MKIDSFLGNDRLKAELRAQLTAGKLVNSVLLCGEAGCGAGWFARLLAADLLYPDGGEGARRVLEGIDADCIELSGTGASGQIPVEEVRRVRSAARETSLCLERRVVVVYGAQNLNAAGANTLLKILEEPPTGVYFLITAFSTSVVLPTIRSRCGCYTLLPPPREACAAYLEQKGVAATVARRLSDVWDGCIGAALDCAAGEHAALFTAACSLCACAAAGDAYGLMKQLAPYTKNRETLSRLLGYAQQLFRGVPAGRPLEELEACPEARALQAIRLLGEAILRLQNNANTKLLTTSLALHLAA